MTKPEPVTFMGGKTVDWVRRHNLDHDGGEAWELEGLGTIQMVYPPKTQTQYLTTEFGKYFWDAEEIEVFYFGEMIEVSVNGQSWKFVAGSDDNWYEFTNDEGEILTVPLMEADDDDD